ncbi:MAG: methyltransferase domain-containing protein [Anaerolineales bacterium]
MLPAPNLPTRLLRFLFYLLYQPLAWSYDLVAWLVSLGQWKRWLFAALPELPGPRVLELGHGPGHLQLALQQQGSLAFGLDPSGQMGRLAARRLSKVPSTNLVRAVAEGTPFKSASFDQVVATFPSEYILHTETLLEVQRALHPNGRFVILPVAWLRDKSTWGKLMAWLFRATGQAGEWDGSFSRQIASAGFAVEEKRLTLEKSELMLLVATPQKGS